MTSRKSAQGANAVPLRPKVDTHTEGRKQDTDSRWVPYTETIHTEAQVRPHLSFKPTVIEARGQRASRQVDGPAHKILARPPGWAQTDWLTCVPPDGLERHERNRHMNQWDTNVPDVAEELCSQCPVRLDCLAAALVEEDGLHHQYRFLVRGGLTPRHRALLDGTKRDP